MHEGVLILDEKDKKAGAESQSIMFCNKAANKLLITFFGQENHDSIDTNNVL